MDAEPNKNAREEKVSVKVHKQNDEYFVEVTSGSKIVRVKFENSEMAEVLVQIYSDETMPGPSESSRFDEITSGLRLCAVLGRCFPRVEASVETEADASATESDSEPEAPEEASCAPPPNPRRRKTLQESLDEFSHIELTPWPGATMKPGPLVLPPMLPLPTLDAFDDDLRYGDVVPGLSSSLYSLRRLQDGFLMGSLELAGDQKTAADSVTQFPSLEELQAAINATVAHDEDFTVPNKRKRTTILLPPPVKETAVQPLVANEVQEPQPARQLGAEWSVERAYRPEAVVLRPAQMILDAQLSLSDIRDFIRYMKGIMGQMYLDVSGTAAAGGNSNSVAVRSTRRARRNVRGAAVRYQDYSSGIAVQQRRIANEQLRIATQLRRNAANELQIATEFTMHADNFAVRAEGGEGRGNGGIGGDGRNGGDGEDGGNAGEGGNAGNGGDGVV